jgi:hypothetical protein
VEFDTYWQNGGYKKISDIIFAECHIFIVSNLCQDGVIDDESLVKTRTNTCLSYASAIPSLSPPQRFQ